MESLARIIRRYQGDFDALSPRMLEDKFVLSLVFARDAGEPAEVVTFEEAPNGGVRISAGSSVDYEWTMMRALAKLAVGWCETMRADAQAIHDMAHPVLIAAWDEAHGHDDDDELGGGVINHDRLPAQGA